MINSSDTFNPFFDTINKMVDFDLKGFLEIYFGQKDISSPVIKNLKTRFIIVHIFTKYRHSVNSFVINRDLIFGHVIIDDHFLGSHDGNASAFARVKPAYMNIGHNFVGMEDVHEEHIPYTVLDKINSPFKNRKGCRIV